MSFSLHRFILDGNFLDKDPVLPSGEHIFPFDCKLPLELPSSFQGQFGRVQYLAKAVIERAGWKSNVICKRAFTVLSGLDLNFIPESAVGAFSGLHFLQLWLNRCGHQLPVLL